MAEIVEFVVQATALTHMQLVLNALCSLSIFASLYIHVIRTCMKHVNNKIKNHCTKYYFQTI